MLLNFLSRDSREWFENIKQIISVCAERMKVFLWFLMYQKGREEVAMSFLLKFGIKVGEIPNEGIEEERKRLLIPTFYSWSVLDVVLWGSKCYRVERLSIAIKPGQRTDAASSTNVKRVN